MSVVKKVAGERSGAGLGGEGLKAKEVANRTVQRSQLSSLLAAKGLDRSNGSLRALEQLHRRSSPIPVVQKDARRANLSGLGEGYLTDSSEENQPGFEPKSLKIRSPSLKVPSRKPPRRDLEESSSLAASLDEKKGFIPPHEMSMPSRRNAYLEVSSRPGSLYEGVGRKLRGLDAVRFRQSVMRQTGFLETPSEQPYT